METRRFGRTGHMSTVAIFGACAVGNATQAEADVVMEKVISAGINHIDVAPSYGHAEERLGPWMPRTRQKFFLGCKTMERSREGAAKELRDSLKRLQTDYYDLYQFHAVTTFEDLDAVTRPGGALEAALEAKEAGLTRFIGITGHGVNSPAIFLEALRRFDFDSILFPINHVQFTNSTYRADTQALLKECRKKDVGTMIIKSVAVGPWGTQPRSHTTWYHPFEDQQEIQTAVNFVLSQDVTGVCTPCDVELFYQVLQACQNYSPISQAEQEALIASAAQIEPLFT